MRLRSIDALTTQRSRQEARPAPDLNQHQSDTVAQARPKPKGGRLGKLFTGSDGRI